MEKEVQYCRVIDVVGEEGQNHKYAWTPSFEVAFRPGDRSLDLQVLFLLLLRSLVSAS